MFPLSLSLSLVFNPFFPIWNGRSRLINSIFRWQNPELRYSIIAVQLLATIAVARLRRLLPSHRQLLRQHQRRFVLYFSALCDDAEQGKMLLHTAVNALLTLPVSGNHESGLLMYDQVARRRYDWFGKSEDCLVLKVGSIMSRRAKSLT